MTFTQSITPDASPKHAVFNKFWNLITDLRFRRTSQIERPKKATGPTRSVSNIPLSTDVATNLAIRAGFTI